MKCAFCDKETAARNCGNMEKILKTGKKREVIVDCAAILVGNY